MDFNFGSGTLSQRFAGVSSLRGELGFRKSRPGQAMVLGRNLANSRVVPPADEVRSENPGTSSAAFPHSRFLLLLTG